MVRGRRPGIRIPRQKISPAQLSRTICTPRANTMRHLHEGNNASITIARFSGAWIFMHGFLKQLISIGSTTREYRHRHGPMSMKCFRRVGQPTVNREERQEGRRDTVTDQRAPLVAMAVVTPQSAKPTSCCQKRLIWGRCHDFLTT